MRPDLPLRRGQSGGGNALPIQPIDLGPSGGGSTRMPDPQGSLSQRSLHAATGRRGSGWTRSRKGSPLVPPREPGNFENALARNPGFCRFTPATPARPERSSGHPVAPGLLGERRAAAVTGKTPGSGSAAPAPPTQPPPDAPAWLARSSRLDLKIPQWNQSIKRFSRVRDWVHTSC